MKKVLLLILVMMGVTAFQTSKAQVRLNVNVNIGTQPIWGPVGYDYVEYYYLPDIDVYYHVPRRQFIYLDGGHWIFATSLPGRYGGFDLYGGYKVVINEPRPYLHDDVYRVKYKRYKGWRGPHQVVIRDSRDERYRRHHDDDDDDDDDHKYKHRKGKKHDRD